MMAVPVFVRLLGELFELRLQRIFSLDGGKQLLPGEHVPIGRDDGRRSMFFEQRDRLCDLCGIPRMRKHDAARILHLIEEKLAEIFKIHPALIGIHDGAEGVELRPLYARALYGADDVGQLSDAGRLDHDAFGRILFRNLFECLCKVTHQRAADAARIHFGDADPCILQKSAVHADLAEFIFNENDLFALVHFADELFDERRLARPQKA